MRRHGGYVARQLATFVSFTSRRAESFGEARLPLLTCLSTGRPLVAGIPGHLLQTCPSWTRLLMMFIPMVPAFDRLDLGMRQASCIADAWGGRVEDDSSWFQDPTKFITQMPSLILIFTVFLLVFYLGRISGTYVISQEGKPVLPLRS